MKKRLRRIRWKELPFDIVNLLVMSIFAFLCIYPLYYVIINAISDNQLVQKGMIDFFPRGIHFQNIIDVFKLKGFSNALFVSFARVVLQTITMLVCNSIVAYAMTKQEFPCRKFFYRFMILTMYVSAGMIPIYLNMKRLGLLNNFWVYIIPEVCAPYMMILMKTYMESIPAAMEDSAVIDGAGYYYRFTRIVVPLSRPILATGAIFSSVSAWNSYMDTVLYMPTGKYQTVQSVLHEYLTRANRIAELARQAMQDGLTLNMTTAIDTINIKFAVTTIAIIPVICFYPFFQRYITEGIMIGAVKG